MTPPWKRRHPEPESPLRDIAYLLEQEAARMKVSTRILEEVVAELQKEEGHAQPKRQRV